MMPCTTLLEDNSEPLSSFGLESGDLDGWRIEFEESELEIDALFDQAKELVSESRKCSTSYIQRSLKIGYNRAVRITQQLEDQGVISEKKDNGTREVLS